MADQSYLVKIGLIMHNKCSQADIGHDHVNRCKTEQRTRTNLAHSHKQMAKRMHPIEDSTFVPGKRARNGVQIYYCRVSICVL